MDLASRTLMSLLQHQAPRGDVAAGRLRWLCRTRARSRRVRAWREGFVFLESPDGEAYTHLVGRFLFVFEVGILGTASRVGRSKQYHGMEEDQ